MNIKQSAVSNKSGFLLKVIPNPKDRKSFLLFINITALLSLIGVFIIILNQKQLMTQDFRHYKEIFKQFGSVSRIGYFFVLSIYPIYLLLKSKKIKTLQWRNFQVKSLLQFLAKIVRKWHVPVALLSTGIIFLHGLLAIVRGFKWDFTYLSGIVATIVLLFLMFMGLKRFKRTDNNWHFKLGIGFFILFMIHATFS